MNNNLIREVIKKSNCKIKKCKIINNAVIYEDCKGNKFVAKENKGNNVIETYNYLNSRGFNYIPKIIYIDDIGYIYRYENDLDIPEDEKISDIIKIISLLHNKTAYYIDNSINDIKSFYEQIKIKIEDMKNYYDDLITMIEEKNFPSPSEYMLLRNCSSIFSCINFCARSLDEWYDIVKDKNKKRIVMLHNNLDINHFIRNNDNVLISWNYAKRDMPIYDFINLYKKNFNKFNFSELYNEYVKNFPLLDEEKKMLFIILFIHDKIVFTQDELLNTKKICNLCNYLYTTDKLFMENNTEYSEK